MARFHFVVTGKCCLRTSINEWIPQSAGDVVLLPLGRGHALADAAQGPTKPLEDFPLEEIGERTFELRGGGGGPKTILACCSVSFEEPSVYPLLELMPVHLLVRSAAQKDASLSALIEVMGSEVTGHRVGSATIMTRLADVVIARIVREWVDTREQDTTGWLAAIRDPKIGRTLEAIHRRPGHPWSVDSLAKGCPIVAFDAFRTLHLRRGRVGRTIPDALENARGGHVA